MLLKRTLFAATILMFSHRPVFGQDNEDGANTVSIEIPEVAILDIESNGSKNISLALNPPSEAGQSIDFSEAVDSSLWLNYSSVRSVPTQNNRSIYARLVSGSVPVALRLRLTARPYSGNGDGGMGVPTNGKVLNNNDRRIIRQIKTCYTGDGPGNGHRLVYALELRNNRYWRLNFDQSTTVTVLLTITDN